jgi:hypothetical protein
MDANTPVPVISMDISCPCKTVRSIVFLAN